MRYIGRWISSLNDSEYPPPHELVGEYDRTIQQKIVDRLNNGHVLHVYRGFATCLFRCNYSEAYTKRTDGHWVWPCDLAHYVETHSVLVPPEFIADAVAATPLPEFNGEWRSQDDDTEYWRDWCNENASGHLKSRIASALETATHEAENVLNTKAEEMQREYGLSSIQCNWAGCTNTALSGKALCGRCCLKGNEEMYVSHLFHVSTAIDG